MAVPSKFNEYPYEWPTDADYNKQSITLPGTERPGETGTCAGAMIRTKNP